MSLNPIAARVKKAFAKRLRAIRVANGYTQEEFSRSLGINRDRYAKYELGISEAPYYVLLRMCALTNTSLDFLVGGKKADQAAPDWTATEGDAGELPVTAYKSQSG